MPPRDGILADLLTTPNHAEPFLTRVKKVVVTQAAGHGELVDQALGDTVWGEISWHRSLGWPIAPRMADGFLVQFKHYEIKDGGVTSGGTVIDKSEWVDGAPPLLWDGPHDEENFRVSFLFFGPHYWKHAIFVQARTGIEWEAMNPWWVPPVRQVVYPASVPGDGIFTMQEVGPTFLDPFTVVNEFYKR